MEHESTSMKTASQDIKSRRVRPRRGLLLAGALGFELCMVLALAPALGAEDASRSRSPKEQATEAYGQRDYLRSAQLFVAAAEQGDEAAGCFYNAACSFALAGKSDEAFSALERGVAAGLVDTEGAKQDTDLASLHGDARWQPLLDRLAASAKAYNEFWNGPAMKTRFRANLSDEEKVAGLSKLWSEAKFNFIHFDKVPDLNWDGVYMEYLPKVRSTKSTFEYYRLLTEMCVRLGDGHTGVWMPKELMDESSARPLLRTALIEGKVLILDVGEPLSAAGLARGLEIVEIDGLPAREYAALKVAPYESASTPQDRDARVYGQALLRGSKTNAVELMLRDPSGKTWKQSVPRVSNGDYWKAFGMEPMKVNMLTGNIAHVRLNSFEDNKTADSFEAVFPQIDKSDGLVLDVRENGGGNSGVGYRVLACLTDKEFSGSKWETRDYRPALRAWGQRETRFGGAAEKVRANGKLLFTKPIVVLTSPRTYSAAEDFAVAFRGMKRGKIFGEVTGGSTGQPLTFPLPGGGGARVCTKHDSFADGTEFVGTGIKPDVAVHPTVTDLRTGRDTVLEAALQELRGK
jgi:C-terminal processing protease CtpA/Prc